MAGKGGKDKKTKKPQGSEDIDSAESDLVAQLANAVVKDEKRKVKDNVKARRKGKGKKKISESTLPLLFNYTLTHSHTHTHTHTVRRTIGRPDELEEIANLLEAQGK